MSSPGTPANSKLYLDDPYLLEFDATVVDRRQHEGHPAVVLDRTAFYAENGGQPWDTGRLNDVQVVAVLELGGAILHVLERPLAADRVHGSVDPRRRLDHMQQHHGQHLLSRAFLYVASARTVSFHLGSDEVTIDLDREVGRAQALAAEARANAVVRRAHPVRFSWRTIEETRALGIEPPPDSGAAIRLVEAEGFDMQPCGGTHPRNTAEVGSIIVLGLERYKGGSRVRFVCGDRAVAAFHARNETLERLGTLLSSPFEQLPDAVARIVGQVAESERRCEVLLERAIEGEAHRLLAATSTSGAPDPVVVAVFDGWSAAELRALALRLVAARPCVALLGSRSEKAHLVFAQSEGLAHDVPALLRQAVEVVEGGGGGKGNLSQGGGHRVDKLVQALDQAERRVRET
jgi:alanyl-tRNA synthetase